MKTILVLIALFNAVLCVSGQPVPEEEEAPMKYFLVETSKGVYEIEDLENATIETRASESDLTYYFYSNRNPDEGVKVTSDTVNVLKTTRFSRTKDTLFTIHGWKSQHESEINDKIRETILKSRDINLFVVDWSPVAGKNYITAKRGVVAVGVYIASFIQQLSSTYGLPISKVSLVGHSLGAHIAGNAGAALGGEVDHIVALDAAGPLFTVGNTEERLDPTDAKFVQVIHTNDGILGFSTSSGHADYYPNGGVSQPGCGIDLGGSCSHARSFDYYAESITQNLFLSTQCSSYSDYYNNRCIENPVSVMGGFGVDYSARGDYYLETNTESPFAKG